MTFLWTRSTYFGAGGGDLITWALNEPVGHFAIEFSNGNVYHSSIHGVELLTNKDFYKRRELVFEHKYKIKESAEIAISKHLEQFLELPYDWKFFFWLTWAALRLKLFGKEIPDLIESQRNNGILCTEALCLLPVKYRPLIDFSRVTTPYKLYKIIKGS